MAWSITIVWVPEFDDHLASVVPLVCISRSSDRAYVVFGVFTPLTAFRNWTPSQDEVGLNHGDRTYVFSRGRSTCRIWVPDWLGSSIGSCTFQRVRSRTWAG